MSMFDLVQEESYLQIKNMFCLFDQDGEVQPTAVIQTNMTCKLHLRLQQLSDSIGSNQPPISNLNLV